MRQPCDEYKGLLVGFIDHELTPGESAALNHHLIRCAACRKELERLRSGQEHIDSLRIGEPHEQVLNNLWRSPYSRWIRNSGLLLVLAGWLVLLVLSVISFLRSPGESSLGKSAVAGIIIGFLILLLSVIRERFKTYKSDPYKEIEK